MDTDLASTQVRALFHKSSDLPCSDLASAFTALIPSHAVFEIALRVLLPILEGTSDEHLSCRIAAAFILYHLYAPHPLDINPFTSSFRNAYVNEKAAVQRKTGYTQLVWTLWKILQGESDEIASLSPELLALANPDIAVLLEIEQLPAAGSREDLIGLNVGKGKYVSLPETHDLPSIDDHEVVFTVQPEVRHTSAALDDSTLAQVSRGVSLLLDARTRVLTLSEKKILTHILEPTSDTRQRYVDGQVQRSVIQCVSSHDLPALVMKNPSVAHLVIISLLSYASINDDPGSPSGASEVLATLRSLPPNTTSFEIYGRLLQDVTCLSFRYSSFRNAVSEEPKPSHAQQIQSIVTVAEYIRIEALGGFLTSCMEWIDVAAAEEKRGFVSDDSVGRAVQLLCRFYNSLVKLGVLDPVLEADSAEMASFALRFSVYAEANALYRALAASRLY